MATVPSFTATPQIDIAQISAANTNRDGTGTIVSILTGGAAPNYLKVESIAVKAIAAIAVAGMVRFYISNDAGVTWKLLHEMLVGVVAASASVAAFEDIWYCPDDLVLPSASYKIGASTEKADTFNLIAMSGKF